MNTQTLGHHFNTRSVDDLFARYVAALSQLEAWGIAINPSSRLRTYESEWRQIIGREHSTRPVAEVYKLMFVERDMAEIVDIVDSFESELGGLARERLQAVCTGSLHPDTEADSPGRDYQWELYLRASLDGARLAEPDLQVDVDGRTVAIEAKRPKTEKRLDDCIRKATDQLTEMQLPGVVALSLDRAIREGRGHVYHAPTMEIAAQRIGKYVETMIEEHRPAIKRRIEGRNVEGVIFHAHQPIYANRERSRCRVVVFNVLNTGGDLARRVALLLNKAHT